MDGWILGFVNVICPCGGYVSDAYMHEWRQGRFHPFHCFFGSTPNNAGLS